MTEAARGAQEWCEAASQHARRYGGKAWRYAIIPHTAVAQNQTLANLTKA